MKQTIKRTIALKRETLRKLSEECLAGAVGGRVGGRPGTGPVDSCEDCTLPPPTGA